MKVCRAEGGFIDLGEYRIAITSIEAVQFIAEPETQTLQLQVLLKSGRALAIAIKCGSGVNPLIGKPVLNTVEAIEVAIRAAIAVAPDAAARSP